MVKHSVILQRDVEVCRDYCTIVDTALAGCISDTDDRNITIYHMEDGEPEILRKEVKKAINNLKNFQGRWSRHDNS